MRIVSSICWAPRGCAASNPEKLQLPSDQVAQILTRTEDDDDDTSTSEKEADGIPIDVVNEFRGVAMYANSRDDPLIENSDSEDEDLPIEPEDNLLLQCCVLDGENVLEVHVYNHGEQSYYPHHHYILEEFPLCVEHVPYLAENRCAGNLCAVGTRSKKIELWNLDIMESMEPHVVLGKRTKPKGLGAKSKMLSHQGPVLSLAWNKVVEHVLASGSVDKSIMLWDLESAKGTLRFREHNAEVQCIDWQPTSDSLLLSGSVDNVVKLWDCREACCSTEWSQFESSVEALCWDVQDENIFYAGTSDGKLHLLDKRATGTVQSVFAHEEGVTDLTISPSVKGCLVTVGADSVALVWKVEPENRLTCVGRKEFQSKRLLCCKFCPDEPWLIAVGGEGISSDMFWNIENSEEVREQFSAPG